MKKATHSGRCQVCGCLQKLPGGRLAKHGYTRPHGWFNGVCYGSGHLPFEQDISLIEGAIKGATARADETQAQADKLLAGEVEGTKAWKHSYRAAKVRNDPTAGYFWEQVEVQAEEKQSGDYKWVAFFTVNSDGKREPIQMYAERNLLQVQQKLNSEYAKRSLLKTVAGLREYVAWQKGRIEGWKAHPEKLIPVDAK